MGSYKLTIFTYSFPTANWKSVSIIVYLSLVPDNTLKLFEVATRISKNVAYFVPRNVDTEQVRVMPVNFHTVPSGR